jgi:hypothetical protein
MSPSRRDRAEEQRKKPATLAATHTPAQNDLPGSVDSVELENMLREINADGAHVAHGWLPLLVIFDDHQFGTQMPSGGHPPHQFECNSSPSMIRLASSTTDVRPAGSAV